MARHAGSATPAVRALEHAGIAYTLHAFDHDPRATSFGQEAAAALGVDPACVFKTLMVSLQHSGERPERPGLAAALVPVSLSLDLKAVARALGAAKARMAQVAEAERSSGYVAGGISPLGQKRRHPTVVDVSALDLDAVLVSAGRRGLDVRLDPADLVALTQAVTAPIGRI